MKTLILYASKHGTTKHCAQTLAKLIDGTVVANVAEHLSLADFDCVVLGTGIYGGKPISQMADFCAKNEAELIGKKLGLFISCINPNEDVIAAQINNAFTETLRANASAIGCFGGRLNPETLSLSEKTFLKLANKADKKDNISTAKIEQFAIDLTA